MDNKFRITVASILVLLIIGMGILAYKNQESWFVSKTEIQYPDGCVEKYRNIEMVTPVCTEGRILQERQTMGGFPEMYADMEFNLSE